jgi:PAS domain S-box-containing protein
MDFVELAQLAQGLRGRRDAIAGQWYAAIASTGFAQLSAAEVRQQLVELADQAISFLVAESLNAQAAQDIGMALVSLHYIQSEALKRTQQVLARSLVEGLPADQIAVLYPRLTALLIELAAGFTHQARETLLAEQEEIRKALTTDLRRAAEALRGARDELEARVQERTAELTAANRALLAEIAERQRVEEALRESEGKFRALAETSSAAIVVYREKMLYMNPTAELLLGYSREELLHMAPWGVVPPEFRERGEGHVLRRLHGATAPVHEEYKIVRKDGQERWIDVSTALVQYEGQPAGLGVAIDITERKRAEEELQQRNRDLAMLNQVSQTLTTTLDLREVTARLMKALTETIGTEGGSVWLLDNEQTGELVCQASYPELERPLTNLRLRPGEGIAGWVAQNGKRAVVSRVSKDSHFSLAIDLQTGFHTTSVLAVPLRVRDRVIGVLEAVNKLSGDFDEHDSILVETLATSAAIAIENARLVETLRRQTAELQARNEELDAFAHTAAHDLKSPLSNIVGYADLLEQEYAALSNRERQKSLYMIAQSGRKMGNIVDEMLLLAGVRQTEAKMEPLDMAGIVAEAQQR